MSRIQNEKDEQLVRYREQLYLVRRHLHDAEAEIRALTARIHKLERQTREGK